MSEADAAEAYFDSRLQFDRKRVVLWSALWDYAFSRIMKDSTTILELGAGWCDFINNATSKRRIAVDLWPGVIGAAAEGVEAHVGSADQLDFIADDSVDAVFASNLVEHLTHDQFDGLLTEAKRVMPVDGMLVLLQPNYRLTYKRYFDDFTHVSVWSEVSLGDFLTSRGWRLERVSARFAPFSVKSRLPVSRFLIRCYLASPVKPFAGQMLIVARNTKEA